MIWLILYLSSIVLANGLVVAVGPVPVGFGLMAPAGVFAVGAALTLRDATQERFGRRGVAVAILGGALLSALLSPALAVASGAAFLLSESADALVYTPLRERDWLWAVLLSNAVGLVVDSVLFLSLAFGSLTYLPGQILGKSEITLLTVGVLAIWRAWRRPLVKAVE